jgi:CBS domain-containing protein
MQLAGGSMKAADVMTTEVVCIRADASVLDAACLLLCERISALPVVEPSGTLLGIVSEGDLIRRAEIGTEKRRSRWARMFTAESTLARDHLKAHGRTVADVMSHPVVIAEDQTDLSVVASRMEEFDIKRLPVVRDGKVIGIVSRANLLQALISLSASTAARADDAALRQKVLRELDGETWSQRLVRNVLVQDRNVEIWGHADTAAQCEACGALAASVPGVRSVINHMVATQRGVCIW